MHEVGVVVDWQGEPLFWHQPPYATGDAIPDSKALWHVLWAHRDRVWGFAHSHAGHGVPKPSWTDRTTMAAIEAGLGRRLRWWITSCDHLTEIDWVGPSPLDFTVRVSGAVPRWLRELRQRSDF